MVLDTYRSKTSPGVSGANKLDSSAEPASSDTSTVLRNEIETETLPRDRMSLMEQRAVIKGNNKYGFLLFHSFLFLTFCL